MLKELRCRDLGFDCDAVVRADSEDEILARAVEHVEHVEHVHRVSSRVLGDPAFVRFVQRRIHDQFDRPRPE